MARPAVGLPLEAMTKALAEQRVLTAGIATLFRMNHPKGFDCPGCAWPDPKDSGAFQYCENGEGPGLGSHRQAVHA